MRGGEKRVQGLDCADQGLSTEHVSSTEAVSSPRKGNECLPGKGNACCSVYYYSKLSATWHNFISSIEFRGGEMLSGVSIAVGLDPLRIIYQMCLHYDL